MSSLSSRKRIHCISIFMLLATLACFSENGLSQTEFLTWPTHEEIIEVSKAFKQTNAVIALPFAYDSKTEKLLTFGIPLSKRIRKGVHSRLAVAEGLLPGGESANYTNIDRFSSTRVGTLFIQVSPTGSVSLGFHGYNSTASNMQYDQSPPPERIFQQISNATSLPIKEVNEKMLTLIERENRRRYPQDNSSRYTFHKDLLREIGGFEPITPEEYTPRPKIRERMTNRILEIWGAAPTCEALKNRLN